MSADLLRRAAALMRERAEAATPGPWVSVVNSPGIACTDCMGTSQRHWFAGVVPEGSPHRQTWLTGVRGHDEALARGDSDHIASWHPAVALAVADWLDRVVASHHAEVDEVCFDECDECIPGDDCQGHDRECCAYCNGSSDEGYVTRILFGRCTPFLDALAVARAYLGESA